MADYGRKRFDYDSAAFKVCMDRLDDGRCSGYVVSRRLKRALEFSDLGELLIQLEDVMDAQQFPQAYQRKRDFGGCARVPPGLLDDTVPYMDAAAVEAAGGRITFTLHILTRRDTSWQGHVLWRDGQRSDFSSGLELLRLIDAHIMGVQ